MAWKSSRPLAKNVCPYTLTYYPKEEPSLHKAQKYLDSFLKDR